MWSGAALPKHYIVRHFTVNHGIGFKNLETGKHASNAEVCHGVIKRWIRAQCYRFGQDSATLESTETIQCVPHGNYNTADNDRGVQSSRAFSKHIRSCAGPPSKAER